MTIRTVEILGIQTRIRDSGGAGDVLFMSSGVGQSLEFWAPQFEGLSDSYRVIAWDYPGHGLSDLGPQTYTIDSLADHAVALLDALNVKKATLVGNSLGGAVSLHVMHRKPDLVTALVLAAPAMFGTGVFLPFRLFNLPFLGELLTKPSAKGVDMQIDGVFHPDFEVSEPLRETIRQNTYKDGGAEHFLKFMRSTLTLRGVKPAIVQASQDILKSATCPVLFIHGKDDKILPVAQSQLDATVPANGRIEVFDKCGHAPQLEKPEKFNALIRNLSLGA